VIRLRYTADSPYAHLNAAAFPWPYESRDDAERVRQACTRPEYIEIVETED
jgi:hypothetical protein